MLDLPLDSQLPLIMWTGLEKIILALAELDFGDGSSPEVFTHSYLLASNVFDHTFSGASYLLDRISVYSNKTLFNNKYYSVMLKTDKVKLRS